MPGPNAFYKCVMLGMVVLLSACTATGIEKYPTGYDRTETHQDIYAPRDTIWKNGSPIDKFLNDSRTQSDGAKRKYND